MILLLFAILLEDVIAILFPMNGVEGGTAFFFARCKNGKETKERVLVQDAAQARSVATLACHGYE